MSEQVQDHFLSSTPVNVAVEALQRQVDQLKRIVHKSDDQPIQHDNTEELQQEIKKLRTENAKAEYRIKMLLRTLEEKDK
ncbi:anthranilate phosphoribosyltransferase [Mucor velutinosus]|uniref:Anthranilate phosphoribosyltransferase n=1 Tax=Mucor velutinosus TaxID=708070 RepID=A0AAN7D7V1_9FUNG|nr:anthranilate phosphoribosyltransferase [Mucor velutinosus]